MLLKQRSLWAPLRCEQGVALIEFAFAMPVLVFLTFAAIEVSNYIYANQKVQNAAYNLLNLVDLQYNLTDGQLDRIAQIVPGVVEPLPLLEGQYLVYVTSLQKDPGLPAYIRWQHVHGPTDIGASRFDFDDAATSTDNLVQAEAVKGYDFVDGDQLIAVEVYMYYAPLLKSDIVGGLFDKRGDYMYFFATARPRKGAFQLDPDELSE